MMFTTLRQHWLDCMMANALCEAIAESRQFYWLKSRKPHGLTKMRDWQQQSLKI